MRLATVKSIPTALRFASDPKAAGVRHWTWTQVVSGEAPASYPVASDESGMFLQPFDQHCLVAGVTGSGKTYSVLAPAVLLCAQSEQAPNLVVIDAKPTLHDMTAERLGSLGYAIVHLDLRTGNGDRYNPLQPIYYARRMGDLNQADVLMDVLTGSLVEKVHSDKDPFWEHTASAYIAGCAYALMEVSGKRGAPTLGQVSEMVSQPLDRIAAAVKKLRDANTRKVLEGVLSSHRAKDTYSSIAVVTQTALSYYNTKVGAHVTSKSTFDLEDALCGGKKTAIFVTAADELGPDAKRFASIFFDMMYRIFVHHRETGGATCSSARGVRLIWDELASFPATSTLGDLLATSRSRNLFMMAGLQSTAQLRANGYSEGQVAAILSQFGNALLFRNADRHIGAEADLRTGGLVTSKDMIGLATGEAFFIRGGSPVLRTQLPPFDALPGHASHMLDGETKREVDELFEDAVGGLSAEEEVAAKYVVDERTAQLEFDRLAAFPSTPTEAEEPWAHKLLDVLHEHPDSSGIEKAATILSQNASVEEGADTRLCGIELAKVINQIAVEKGVFAVDICMNMIVSGVLPYNPVLSDSLYLGMIRAMSIVEHQDALVVNSILFAQHINHVRSQFSDPVYGPGAEQLKELASVGRGLVGFRDWKGDNGSEGSISASHAHRTLRETIDSLKPLVAPEVDKCATCFEALANEGVQLGSMLVGCAPEDELLQAQVVFAGAFGALVRPDVVGRMRAVVTDSMRSSISTL